MKCKCPTCIIKSTKIFLFWMKKVMLRVKYWILKMINKVHFICRNVLSLYKIKIMLKISNLKKMYKLFFQLIIWMRLVSMLAKFLQKINNLHMEIISRYKYSKILRILQNLHFNCPIHSNKIWKFKNYQGICRIFKIKSKIYLKHNYRINMKPKTKIKYFRFNKDNKS